MEPKEEQSSPLSDAELDYVNPLHHVQKMESDGEVETNDIKMEPEDPEDEVGDWTLNDRLALLESIRSQCPKKDVLSYSRRGRKIDWNKVSVEKFSSHQCQLEWELMLKQVRKYRTMLEVLDEAEYLVQNPREIKKKSKLYPDQPTKPLTAYLRYLMDHRGKVKKKHPEMTSQEITKYISQRWQTLSPKKQEKYRTQYLEEKKKFLKDHEEFLQKHPQAGVHERVRSKPPKPPTPFFYFYQAKLPKTKRKHPELNNIVLSNQLRCRYAKLKPSRKKKWIDQAWNAVPEYEAELEKYQRDHPDYKTPAKKILLSKEEQIISGCSPDLDIDEVTRKMLEAVFKSDQIGGRRRMPKRKFPGAPDKPPRTPYQLFIKKRIPKMTGTMSEKMSELGQQWHSLGEERQKHYAEKLADLKVDYQWQLEEFEKTLSPEDLEAFRESCKPKKKKKKEEE